MIDCLDRRYWLAIQDNASRTHLIKPDLDLVRDDESNQSQESTNKLQHSNKNYQYQHRRGTSYMSLDSSTDSSVGAPIEMTFEKGVRRAVRILLFPQRQ